MAFIATELAAGLLYGITEKENMDALSPCFSNPDEFVKDVLVAYQNLTNKSFVGMQVGSSYGLELLSYLPTSLETCTDYAVEDFTGLAEWAQERIHVETKADPIEFNLRHNQVRKFRMEMIKVNKHYLEDSYFQLGEDLGEMLSILTKPLPVKEDIEADFFSDGHSMKPDETETVPVEPVVIPKTPETIIPEETTEPNQ